MDGQPERAPKKARGGAGGLLLRIALSGALTFGLIEGALRVRQLARYGTVGDVIALTDHESGLEIPIPATVQGGIVIDSRGFRSPELTVPKPAGTLRLAFLGGSTTYCAQSTSNATTWPSLLVDKLREEFPNARLDFVNAGVPGYTTRESLLNLRARVAELEPDVIFIYHATNDLTHDTRQLAEELNLIESARGSGLGQTWSLAWNLVYKNLQAKRRGEGRGAVATLDVDPETYSGTFRKNLRALITEAEREAERVVVASFSHRTRPSQTEAERREASSSSLYYMPYMTPEGIIAAFAEFNRVIREEAWNSHVLLVESEDLLAADSTCFTDSVHFTDEGCRRMAERFFDALVRDEAFRQLVGAP